VGSRAEEACRVAMVHGFVKDLSLRVCSTLRIEVPLLVYPIPGDPYLKRSVQIWIE